MSNADRTLMSFSPITDEQVYKIHLASLEILERTGVAVQEDEARQLLLAAGCYQGRGQVIRIPAVLVQQALLTAPERIVLYSRDGRPVLPLEGDRVFFGTGSDTPKTIDPYSRERRPVRKQDVRNIARFSDALDNINFIMSMGIPEDVPKSATFVHEFEAMVSSSTKPMVFTAYDNRDMETIYEMATVIAGGGDALRQKPFLMLYSEPLAPLQHTRIGTEKLLYCAAKGLPCAYIPGVMAGGNGPVTLAGAIALANAECLSGLVIAQLKKAGAPFLYGANVTTMDMKSCILSYAAPEFALTNSIFAALAHYYHLPVWGLAGCADSKILDAQAGAESAVSIYTALLSGGNLVHDVGYLESGLTSCMEMILLGDELIDMCRRLTRGVELDDASFALDVIDQIGPGGDFLSSDHTLENFRQAHWLPRFLDRRRIHSWQEDGSRDMYDRLNVAVKKILETHQPAPLPDDQAKELARILAAHEAADAKPPAKRPQK